MSLYQTGFANDGRPLLGGLWRLWREDGFPVELGKLETESRGARVDWLELMADAAECGELPAAWRQVEGLLPPAELERLKVAFSAILERDTLEHVLERKRAFVGKEAA